MKKYGNLRINLFLGIVVLASSLILYRLFVLSVVRHSFYSLTAQAQNESISNILARGNIYFSEKDNPESLLAATNKKFPLAYIIPSDIKSDKAEGYADSLAKILNTDKAELLSKMISGSSSLKVIARRIEDVQVRTIKEMGVKGIGVSYESDRFYPGEGLAANVLGFLGYDSLGLRAGQYGIEEFYNKELSGRSANASVFSLTEPFSIISSLKNFIKKDSKSVPAEDVKAEDPADIFLTVDKNIQAFIQNKLENLLKKWEAEKGTIIVQEPKTGKILAMADWPTFDPNKYSITEHEHFLNNSIQAMYEPGSSFKPVTMSAGIDLAKVTPQTSYDDVGFVNIAGFTIHNFSNRVFGRQTMTEVLQNSVNTGTMFVENIIGDDNFLNYVINMGFGQKTGIDLPGEVSGDVTNLYSGRKINFLTASFGQGIAVTPLQLINAYSAIANGGKLMKPYIVERISRGRGEDILSKPEIVSIPISKKTAEKLQTMLIGVVDKGFDKARITGYDIAGKTGTAQIPDGSGGYSEHDFIHNFLGFAPGYDAKFTILIKMDRPKGIQFAADSLSPTFKEIASFLLNYYNIPPTRK